MYSIYYLYYIYIDFIILGGWSFLTPNVAWAPCCPFRAVPPHRPVGSKDFRIHDISSSLCKKPPFLMGKSPFFMGKF